MKLDPERSPLRCDQNQQSAAKAWQYVSLEYITNTIAERGGAGIQSEKEVEFYQATIFEGPIEGLISLAENVTVIGQTICFDEKLSYTGNKLFLK